MSVELFEAILVLAVFLGAVVQGFSRFAFSALLFFSGAGLVA